MFQENRRVEFDPDQEELLGQPFFRLLQCNGKYKEW